MDRWTHSLVLVFLVAVAPVAAQDDPPVVTNDSVPTPVVPLLNPPEIVTTDEEGNQYTGIEELEEWTAERGDIGWLDRIIEWFWAWWRWFVDPICRLLTIFVNWIGLPQETQTLDFQYGAVGYYLGIIDAWLPVHEIIYHTLTLLGVSIIWMPFKLIIKYFFPGLGG